MLFWMRRVLPMLLRLPLLRAAQGAFAAFATGHGAPRKTGAVSKRWEGLPARPRREEGRPLREAVEPPARR